MLKVIDVANHMIDPHRNILTPENVLGRCEPR
jgi:hypothetical protein